MKIKAKEMEGECSVCGRDDSRKLNFGWNNVKKTQSNGVSS